MCLRMRMYTCTPTRPTVEGAAKTMESRGENRSSRMRLFKRYIIYTSGFIQIASQLIGTRAWSIG